MEINKRLAWRPASCRGGQAFHADSGPTATWRVGFAHKSVGEIAAPARPLVTTWAFILYGIQDATLGAASRNRRRAVRRDCGTVEEVQPPDAHLPVVRMRPICAGIESNQIRQCYVLCHAASLKIHGPRLLGKTTSFYCKPSSTHGVARCSAGLALI